MALTEMFFHADHMRDHLASLLHHQHIADADVLAGDLVRVVQARPTDDRAREFHRLEVSHGCDRAAAAHLHADPGERGRGLELLELPGDRPPRTFGRRPKDPLLVKPVDLHHEAIDFEVEVVQFLDQFGAPLHERVERTEDLRAGGDWHAGPGRPGQEFGLRSGPEAGRIAHAVAEEPQRPRRAFPRVEEANAASRHVPGVGERRQAFPRLRLVERHEVGVGHVDLAADLDRFRWLRQAEHQGHAVDRTDVMSDVVAHDAVAPRGGLLQRAVFVPQ